MRERSAVLFIHTTIRTSSPPANLEQFSVSNQFFLLVQLLFTSNFRVQTRLRWDQQSVFFLFFDFTKSELQSNASNQGPQFKDLDLVDSTGLWVLLLNQQTVCSDLDIKKFSTVR